MFSTKNLRTKEITYKEIKEQIPEYQLWCYLLGFNPKIGEMFNSPLRDDKSPSAKLFETRSGSLILIDFGLGKWSPPGYLMYSRGLSYPQALNHLYETFSLKYTPEYPNQKKVSVMKPNELREPKFTKILVKRKPWETQELDFWKEYHISKETLDILKIAPISHYWVLDTETDEFLQFSRKPQELIFCIQVEDKFKIYRPLEEEFKWITNCTPNDLIGLESVWESDTLVLTKGAKELGILRELKINSCSLQGEHSYPDRELMDLLKVKYKKIYSIFDVDSAGQSCTKYFKNNYQIIPIIYPVPHVDFDFANYAKENSLEIIQQLLKEQLNG